MLFHIRVANHARRLNIPFIAVVPKVEDARLYAGRFQGAAAIATDLRKIGISGTPSLMLVDSLGLVKALWVGKLGSLEEGTVLARLDDRNNTIMTVDGKDFVALDSRGLEHVLASKVLLDVRPRDEFLSRHEPRALNYPVDELPVRARIELDPIKDTVIDCTYTHASVCRLAGEILRDLRFRNVRLLNSGLRMLACQTGRIPD